MRLAGAKGTAEQAQFERGAWKQSSHGTQAWGWGAIQRSQGSRLITQQGHRVPGCLRQQAVCTGQLAVEGWLGQGLAVMGKRAHLTRMPICPWAPAEIFSLMRTSKRTLA